MVDITNWLVVSTPLKNISQLELLLPYMKWKIKNVPNHQPDDNHQPDGNYSLPEGTPSFFGRNGATIVLQPSSTRATRPGQRNAPQRCPDASEAPKQQDRMALEARKADERVTGGKYPPCMHTYIYIYIYMCMYI